MKTRRHHGMNLFFSRTEKSAGEERWYKLDNAASFMPALTDSTATLVFRISATLTERIYLPSLAEALANLAPRFPYFLVELRRGFFWYYLQPVAGSLPEPVADSRYPCLGMHIRRRGRFLFRVRAYHSRIAVEFCHVLTDGAGALVYLKAVIMEYLRLRGVDTVDAQGIFRPGDRPDPQESQDAFNLHYRKGMPYPEVGRKAFHFPSMPLRRGQYRVTTGIIPLAAVIAKAKAYGTTLTEFIVSAYLASLQDLYLALPAPVRGSMKKLLAAEVPVNLRRLFPSKTMRNFTLYVMPSLDLRLGFYDFDEILKRVHHFMQAEIHEKNMSMQIARNVGGGRNLTIRMLPLAIKGIAARWVFKHVGEDTMSGIVSNLGAVDLPEALASHVERFEFIPAPSHRCRTNPYLVSWKDRLFISFGSTAASTEVERLFFTRLSGMGIPVAIESNR